MPIRISESEERRDRLRAGLRLYRVSGWVVTALPNVRYLSGFTGSNAILLLSSDRAILFTDPRYQTQAALECDCDIKIVKGPLLIEVARWIQRLRLKSVAFEQNRIGYDDYVHLKELGIGVRLKPVSGAIESLRAVKSAAEVATIRASVQLNSAALEQALRHFKYSMTEVDLAAEIEYRMRRLGADGTAFETIVASGERTALPHARPTDHPIREDELLLIDMGASVAGYASDMTRTFAAGKLDTKKRRMYRAVLESQLAAVHAVRPGVTCASVDAAARKVLRGFGMEKQFIHSTGHGLGLEIHERPRIGRKEATKLETGMVITIEPGVYQKGLGGVRIEDTVVVTTSGCQILTPTSKELFFL
ncbi:MAG TPA: Xaa-Pro peptidase family protein [Bryobacteraceae bacterium]|nr:Xaa-Pro peptidase family protein [Bryobacteraceae bacterium]